MNNFPSEIRAYRPIALCGSGAYGSVYLVADAVGSRFALKIVRKTAIGGSWEREFRGLTYYKTHVPEHPNLIRIFHIEDCGDFFYYTMDAADDLACSSAYRPATLENLIENRGSVDAGSLRTWFNALLDALEHLHDSGVIHRDVKPDNIIFVNGVPKLGDIGLLDTMSHTLSLAGTQDFIPPEYLLGHKKEVTADIDLYALGKTFYCAFAGCRSDQFPLVSPELLKDAESRAFNRLVRAVCESDPRLRLKTIGEFRNALNGKIGWTYDFGRFLSVIIFLPIVLAVELCKILFCRKWIFFLLMLLVLIWAGMVLKTYVQLEKEMYPYQNGFHDAAFKRAFSEWYRQLGKYDLYDFEKKTEYSIRRYGERRLVMKDEYLRRKNPGIPPETVSLAFEIGFPEDQDTVRGNAGVKLPQVMVNQLTPLRYEYLHEKVFDKLTGNSLSVPYGTEWRDKTMVLAPNPKGVMKYRSELPLISEVDLTFDPSRINGKLEFVLTAAEYIPDPKKKLPDSQWKRQMRFPLTLENGQFILNDAIYRDQDKTEDELMMLCKPQFTCLSAENRFYRLKIITADSVCRVYLDRMLIWASRLAFHGGYFEMRYKTDGKLKIGHFTVYDAGIVQPGEKRTSRLKLP